MKRFPLPFLFLWMTTTLILCNGLQIGDIALEDPECRSLTDKLLCGTADKYSPICAQLPTGKYVEGDNLCDFCSKNGLKEATIVKMGVTDDEAWNCGPKKAKKRRQGLLSTILSWIIPK